MKPPGDCRVTRPDRQSSPRAALRAGAVVTSAALSLVATQLSPALGSDVYQEGMDAADPRNVLIIIADDMGVDTMEIYGVGESTANTPHLDALAENGVLFENAWAYPICTPFRAAALTGRFGFRTGVGTVPDSLPRSETIVPEILRAQPELGVAHAAIGKWHLGGGDTGPTDHGFGHFAGTIDGFLDDYYAFQRVVNGHSELEDGYATTVQVDDASAWIEETGDQPWFIWLAFNAPHEPFHRPPDDLHTVDLPPGDPPRGRGAQPFFHAAIEAMDTEIGRLLDEMDPNVRARTTIIFMGDNGSPARTISAPFNRQTSKSTLYQGGVWTPLIISGVGISEPGRRVAHLVHSVDLAATSLDLLGVPAADWPDDIDGQSLRGFMESPGHTPLRDWAFTEKFGSRDGSPTEGKAIRDLRFKYIRFDDGTEALFDLENDPYEARELFAAGLTAEALAAVESLRARLDALLASPPMTSTPAAPSRTPPTVAATPSTAATHTGVPPTATPQETPLTPTPGDPSSDSLSLFLPVAKRHG